MKLTQVDDRAVLDRIRACDAVFGWTTFDELEALYRAARDVDVDGVTLEIGCYLGRSTIAIARGLEDRGKGDRLTIIDCFKAPDNDFGLRGHMKQLHRQPQEVFRSNMAKARVDNFDLIVGMSQDEATRAQVPDGPIRLAFLDGDHGYDAVRSELDWIAPRLVPGSIVGLDDYGANESEWGVRRAYEDVLKDRVRREVFYRNTQALIVEVGE